jgi:hypothetical protein
MASAPKVERFARSRLVRLSLASVILAVSAWALLAHFNSQALHWIVAGSGPTGAPGIMINE